MALRFVISNPDIHCLLGGSGSVAKVEQNVAAIGKGLLPGDVLRRLDEITGAVPCRLFNEPFAYRYEISFTRHFYQPQPLRTLDEIRADILAVEKEAEGLLDELLKGNMK